jgi:hypothetical protein
MTAANLLLQGISGWCIHGDPIQNTISKIRYISHEENSDITTYEPEIEQLPALDSEITGFDGKETDPIKDSTRALNDLMDGNVTLGVTNPPYAETNVNNTISNRFKTATQEPRDDSQKQVISSQKYSWLFLELLCDCTHRSGSVTALVPESIKAIASDREERGWLVQDATHLIGSIDLPESTFQPATGTKTGFLALKPRSQAHKHRKYDHEVLLARSDDIGEKGNGWEIDPYVDDSGTKMTRSTDEICRTYEPRTWITDGPVAVPNCDLPSICERFSEHVKNHNIDRKQDNSKNKDHQESVA